jgi:uncharacterized SAM-binding protein YcdF (DUF218 family)
MFLFKKIVAPFLFPLPLCLLLLVTGLALLWLTRRQRAGKLLVTAGVALLTALSYGFVSERLVVSLERRHAPADVRAVASRQYRWVVVLGAGTSADAELPAATRLSEASLARLVEGVRLHRALPGSRLVVSGGPVFGSGSDAEAMRDLAVELGVEPSSIVTEAESPDTESQAVNLRPVVGEEEFLLVTSASHMPRSLALFEKAGTKPAPAPAHFTAQRGGLSPSSFFPGSGGLRRAETAFHEYLGLAWAKLRGRI